MDKVKEVSFCGKVIKCLWESDNYKIYALDIDIDNYPDIKRNKYNNVCITGDIPKLIFDAEYEVIGIEQNTKNGISYKVKNIRRNLPTKKEDVLIFLKEILTEKQATTLYTFYPDIIDRVKENRLDDVDLNKLKGIKEYTFNIIKTKIEENFVLSDLVIEFKGFLSFSIIKKIYEKYTSVDKLKEKLNANPYECLCSLGGVGFKTADNILIEIEKISNDNKNKGLSPIIDFNTDLLTSKERCLACLIFVLQDNENNGNTKMNLIEARKEVLNLVPECINYFTESIKDEKIYYNKESLEIALKKTKETEAYIAETVLHSLKESKNNVWNIDIKQYKHSDKSNSLTNEQLKSLYNVCNYNISILNGSAGTGKTFTTKSIIKMLNDNNKSFMLLAPTGRASKVISEYANEPAYTIHRGLGYNPKGIEKEIEDKYGNKKKIKKYWEYDEYNKIYKDIIIIDEFSMVDIHLFKVLLKAIDIKYTKLLLIGDNAQLPSVGCGNLLHDFLESHCIPYNTLTQIFRYNEGGLMRVATDVRNGKRYLKDTMKNSVTTFGTNKDYIYIDSKSEDVPLKIMEIYKQLLNKNISVEDILVLTAKNIGSCGTLIINQMIQKIANKNYGSKKCLKIGEKEYYKGDIIIQQVNNYNATIHPSDFKTFIANGESGIIIDIEPDYAIIDFNGHYIRYNKSEMNMISLGYCITIHKSQGGSAKNIIIATPQSDIYMTNSNLLYVALTRMKEKCYHIGTYKTINMAIDKKINLQRNTFLQENLININETGKINC